MNYILEYLGVSRTFWIWLGNLIHNIQCQWWIILQLEQLAQLLQGY